MLRRRFLAAVLGAGAAVGLAPAGASGSFLTADGKRVKVNHGIVVAIEPAWRPYAP